MTSTTPEPSPGPSKRRCSGFPRSPCRWRWITTSRSAGAIGRAPPRSSRRCIARAYDRLHDAAVYWNLNVPNVPLEHIRRHRGDAAGSQTHLRTHGRPRARRRDAILSSVGVTVRDRSRNARHRHRRSARGLRQLDAPVARPHRRIGARRAIVDRTGRPRD